MELPAQTRLQTRLQARLHGTEEETEVSSDGAEEPPSGQGRTQSRRNRYVMTQARTSDQSAAERPEQQGSSSSKQRQQQMIWQLCERPGGTGFV
ncbi:unnamed protein product [Merluccius merluccius]